MQAGPLAVLAQVLMLDGAPTLAVAMRASAHTLGAHTGISIVLSILKNHNQDPEEY